MRAPSKFVSARTLSRHQRAGEWLRPHADQRLPESDAPARDRTIGVLALQGAFAEHGVAFARLGATIREVRRIEHLEGVEALALPGGESTTMSKLLMTSGLFSVLGDKISDGFPVFGTCAGMILLAKGVLDGRPDQRSWGAMDIDVRRNGYGRQIDSFEADISMPALAHSDAPVNAVFIRAPKIERIGPEVEILGSVDEVPVVVRQNNLLAASFHPEMTEELRIHRYFLEHVLL